MADRSGRHNTSSCGMEMEQPSGLHYNDLIVALWNMVDGDPANHLNLNGPNQAQQPNAPNEPYGAGGHEQTSLTSLHSACSSSSSSSSTPTPSAKPKAACSSVLEYCPNFVAFDARARKESKERISSHLRERQKLVLKCIESVRCSLECTESAW